MKQHKSIHIIIPSLLLLLALVWVTLGSNFLNDGYGLKREKQLTSPSINSTHEKISSIADLNGYTTYLTFGFSHCQDNCPFTLSQFIKLASLLPKDIKLIFVSIDNTRDDITHLKRFLTNIHPAIIGWSMPDDALKQFARQFNTPININSTSELQHSSAIQVIDTKGKWVKTYPYLNLNDDAVLKDYKSLQKHT